jgi:hypothetical protein
MVELPPSDSVSVAFPFDSTPDGENELPVVSLWIWAKFGKVVPAGAAMVIVPGDTSPPVELAVNPNESLT